MDTFVTLLRVQHENGHTPYTTSVSRRKSPDMMALESMRGLSRFYLSP